jgi:hypothetical protein
MLDFAYVSFVNNNQTYIDLMKTTIQSIIQFSKYKFIIYCVGIPNKVFEDHEQIIIRNIDDTLNSVYYYKPFVITDAIKQGLKSGFYIEADDVLTPIADNYLYYQSFSIKDVPLSPIHPDDVIIPENDIKMIDNNLSKTQHYIHGHVLFNSSCLPFIEEWLYHCVKSNHFFRNADETVLNLMYWKYNCKNHYLKIIDPWYENFYNEPNSRKIACTFHGCKEPNIQKKLLDDIKKELKNI